MDFSCRTAALLHDDHQATIRVIESLEQLLAKAKRVAPTVDNAAQMRVLDQVATAIEGEIESHFTFEETELFPRLAELGDVGITVHLTDEHAAILPLGKTLAKQARTAASAGFPGETWSQFRENAGELIERMFTHIQKEEMALLPILEDVLDPETDMELSTNYANIIP